MSLSEDSLWQELRKPLPGLCFTSTVAFATFWGSDGGSMGGLFVALPLMIISCMMSSSTMASYKEQSRCCCCCLCPDCLQFVSLWHTRNAIAFFMVWCFFWASSNFLTTISLTVRATGDVECESWKCSSFSQRENCYSCAAATTLVTYSNDVGRCRSTNNQMSFVCYGSDNNDPESACEAFCDCLEGSFSCYEETSRGIAAVVVGWINTVSMWAVGFCSYRVWKTSTTLIDKWGILAENACHGGHHAPTAATGSLQMPTGSTVVVGQPVGATGNAVVGAPSIVVAPTSPQSLPPPKGGE